MKVNCKRIRKAVETIFQPGQVVEVRALEVKEGSQKSTYSGFFDDYDKMIESVEGIKSAKGIYFTLNPVHEDLLQRCSNKMERAKRDGSTSDTDVIKRNWLLIDLDPVRASSISSTDEEHEAALSRAKECSSWLKNEFGWPKPILADSGNGAHLLYRIDLDCNDDGLVKKCLEALAFRFDDSKVTVDTTVHNPGRICRFYGTTARKGTNTTERPHRVSGIIKAPDTIEITSSDKLFKLAETLPNIAEKSKSNYSDHISDNSFDIDGWILKHNLDVTGSIPWQSGRKWIFEVCPWNSNHTNRSAYILQLSNGAISAGCHHKSCSDKGWHDLRAIYDIEWKEKQVGNSSKSYMDSNKVRIPDYCNHLLDENDIIYERGKFHYYKGGVYLPNGMDFIKHQMLQDINDKYNSKIVKDVLFRLETELKNIEGDELLDRDFKYINVENGLIDYNKCHPVLIPHTPDYYSTVRIPIEFKASATCSNVEQFLAEVFPEDCIDFIYEVIGYCMIASTKFEKAFMLIGMGANGKSTFLKLLQAFLGKMNYSTESLQDLAGNRFRPIHLESKLANIYPDLPSQTIKDTGIFKALVSGDEITAEKKNKDPHSFKNFARLIFSANELPRSLDNTDAFFRRWVIIRFSNCFKGKAADVNLISKLTTEAELSGLLNKALIGLKKLLERGEFDIPESTKKELKQYENDCDSVKEFVDEMCILDTDEKVLRRDLFNRYNTYCEENNYKKLSKQKYNKRLDNIGINEKCRKGGSRAWKGISLKNYSEIDI